MKRFFFYSVLAGLLCGCGESETDQQSGNGNGWLDPWDPLVSVVDTWRLWKTERYAPNGTLVEQFSMNGYEQNFYIFNEAGFYRYFENWEIKSDGTYTYDARTQRLQLDAADRHISVTTGSRDSSMRWSYEADGNGYRLVEYYEPCDDLNLPAPPEKEGDMTIRIPDPNFKAYMVQNFDTDSNGEISVDEAARITYISVWESPIASLEGIEYCIALKKLDCYHTPLTNLDVSRNTALTMLYCSGNQLTNLNVSQNTALKDLNCADNQLTNLDISQNTALTRLYCSYNQLMNLDVSKNTALTDLSCSGNQLTSLDISQNTVLTTLWCNNNQLMNLDVSRNTALKDLTCYNNQLTNLDVSKNTALTGLICYNNQLTNLDISQNTVLTTLWCNNNQLMNLDVSKNTALKDLRCENNQLTNLDVSQNAALTYLSCHNNQLTNLDVSKNTALTDLWCNNNQLISLDISNCLKLEQLWLVPMPSLKTLYMEAGQQIELQSIPPTTEIIYK